MSLMGRSGGGPTVGIDIGSSLIKVVEARPGKEGVQITALGVGPTPPGTIDNDIIMDPQSLGQALKQLLTESGIKCKRCVSSVSGQSSVVVRIIDVPKMTRQELTETMKWEVERHVPFAANEVVMDFQPIEKPGAAPDDQNMEVLLAVAQQEVVNTHVETLFAAGLEPTAIDIEPLAVCRSLVDITRNGEQAQTVAIVNIGADTTDMGVFQNGLLAFPRTIPIAGDAVTRAISDTLSIPMEQAEQLKRERGYVMMDRVSYHAPSTIMGDVGEPGMLGDMPPANATMGLAPPADDSADDFANMGFIPGLGFTEDAADTPAPPPVAPAPAMSAPDFDIDLGTAPAASGPSMAFDLSDDSAPIPSAPRPALDLGSAPPAPEDFMAPSQDLSFPPVPVNGQVGEDGSALTDEAIFDAMAPVLADLAAEIRRSLEYYASRYQSQPDKILVCGGTAKLRDIDRFFEAELGMPVSIANPLKNAVVFSRSVSEDYLEEVAAIFPVSVGLAVRDMIGE